MADDPISAAEAIAIDRISRAIEKGTGHDMTSSARIARAAIGYLHNAGVEIVFVGPARAPHLQIEKPQ
jgi:phosphomannomutase